MADAIATPDFALGDSNIGEFIIDLAAADSAVELGPFVGVSMVEVEQLRPIGLISLLGSR